MDEHFGIRCILASHPQQRPRILLKKTPDDFVVHELDPAGKTVVSGAEYADEGLRPNHSQSIVLQAQQLSQLGIPSTDADEIVLLWQRKRTEPVTIDAEFSKAQRSVIHAFFKPMRGLVTDCPQPGRVRIMRRGAQVAGRDRRNDAPSIPFLECVLEKRGLDTMEAVTWLAQVLGGRSLRDFSFAGTKDRRAVTSQRLVVRGIEPQRLLGVNKQCTRNEERWLRVSRVAQADGPLRLGDLSGNAFSIRLTCEDEDQEFTGLEANLHSLATVGFVNYFGMQRFGTHRCSTDQVGQAMVIGDLSAAIDMIISDRFPDVRQAFISGDMKQAAQQCPRFLQAERCILEHLAQHPRDYEGALMVMPRETRLLYLHAWQSRIFNEAASLRVALGTKVLIGDVAMSRKKGGGGGDEDSFVLVDDDLDEFTIDDIVIPLPGHNVIYPTSFDYPRQQDVVYQPRNRSFYDLAGTYRKLIVKPQGLTWSVERPIIQLSFALPSSSYATMALREAFDCYEP